MDMLLAWSERFREVPAEVACRPFPPAARVPGCESEVYVWARPEGDGTLRFYFAVENPQGVSAKAMAAILDEAASGAPLEEVLQIPEEAALDVFGGVLTWARSQGLTSMVAMVKALARTYQAAAGGAADS